MFVSLTISFFGFPSLTDVYIMLLTSLYDAYSLQILPLTHHLHFLKKINLFIYLFIFGCVGSSFLCEGFL